MLPILELDSVSKSFGGLQVSRNISFSVKPGEISAIIGPNGAGKTTLFNQISGFLVPDKGSIQFEGKELIGQSPQNIVASGIGRAFQISSIFPDETVLDNIKASCLARVGHIDQLWQPITNFKQVTNQAYSILESLGLERQAEHYAYELAHGDQKLLDIGIALALEPKLLLLDEPTAGMSPEERQTTRKIIKKLWKEFNLSLVFIEHDMDMVFDVAQTIMVLQQGVLIAQGSPEEIQGNSEVVAAYLGEEL